MKADNVLLSVALIAVIVAMVGSFYTYNSIQSYKQSWFTGQAINEGTLIVNISATAIINFTKSVINFSYGSVAPGALYANLSTPYGVLLNGNWTNQSNGFIIENQGSTNLSLSLKTSIDSTNIGGAGAGFWWNVTNYLEDGGAVDNNGSSTKAGNYSCLNAENASASLGTFNLSSWTPVRTTSFQVCDKFSYKSGNNSIKVDVLMQIPRDAPAANLTTVFTATATCCVV